jgi:hypothetical protein
VALAVTMLLAGGVAMLPAVQARVKAVGVVADALRLPVTRPFASAVTRTETAVGGVRGDVYWPGTEAPAILLVHGAAPLGKDDPRFVRLAFALARAGRVVFAPALELAERRFDPHDLQRIVDAAAGLADDPRVEGRPEVLGISYGGSFSLVAAADPRIRDRISQVAVFGAYFDIVGVIQAITTGTSVVGDRRIPWSGDPRAADVLSRYAVGLAPPRDREALQAALAGGGPDDLRPAARAIHALLMNRDPTRTFELAGRLSPGARAELARFSPSSVAGQIRAPVVAMHSADDPAVPYGEAIRLQRGIPGTRLVTATSFTHVDLAPAGWGETARNLVGVWRFATWILEPGE